ncbi:MAG: transposase [Gammaproteobacteria bacterium]|nr:transposase [Gammaproteobacteria bacterium]
MARLPRFCLPGIPQHIIQRGNNRQACFACDENFAAYVGWLEEYSRKYHVNIHAWVFMTNHVHLLVTPSDESGVSNMMQSLGRMYVRYFNRAYRRTGTLWEGRYKSSIVDAENYLLTCMRYIELNPVRAGMVNSPEEYTWSSYHANGLGKVIKLCTPHLIYKRLGRTVQTRTESYRDLFRYHLEPGLVGQIRISLNQGMVLGNERFKEEVEQLSGRRTSVLKPGPKPRKLKEFLL